MHRSGIVMSLGRRRRPTEGTARLRGQAPAASPGAASVGRIDNERRSVFAYLSGSQF
jgi:hypothetical protein